MLKCEGHKMFCGTIVCEGDSGNRFQFTGVWLYQPEHGFWYLAPTKEAPWGTSVDSRWVVEIIEEDPMEELREKVRALEDMVITDENREEARVIWERIRELVG